MNHSVSTIMVNGLCKSFGRKAILRDLNLEVASGEILTILGPNGSGKTTLMRILATLSKPDSGEICMAGVDVIRFGHLARKFNGVVTHDPMLYGDLTGYENLALVGKMFGLDNIHDRVGNVAKILDIHSVLDQRVGILSNGIRKRISIARAILHDPAFLLLDEPETGLDQEALVILDEVIKNGRRTVLMTTHNVERGLELGDRVAVLSKGRISHHQIVDSSLEPESFRQLYLHHAGTSQ